MPMIIIAVLNTNALKDLPRLHVRQDINMINNINIRNQVTRSLIILVTTFLFFSFLLDVRV